MAAVSLGRLAPALFALALAPACALPGVPVQASVPVP
jgi:hypothetical protein